MAGGTEGSAGLIGKAELSGTYDFGSSATSSAQGGRIGGAWVANSSGGNIGIVKMLAITGIAVLLYKMFRGR